jgi:DNA-binding transcriptional LysR family regulator
VLGRRPLVDREIESGALVEAGAPSIDSHGAYWLVSSEGVDQRPDLASFRNWLLEEAEQPAREHAGS